jgi:predicted RNA binding protein YcfA (HicA-like mRNA interferase family)
VPKLGVFSGEEICRILETEGFLRVRQKGSHTILQKRTEQTRRFTIGASRGLVIGDGDWS